MNVDAPLAEGVRARARLDSSSTLIGVPGRIDFTTPNATQGISNDTALFEIEHATRTSTLTLTGSGLIQRLAYNDPANGGENDAFSGRSQLSLKDAFAGERIDAVVGIDLTRESATYYFAPGQAAATSPAVVFGAAQSQVAGYLQLGASPYRKTRIVAGLRAENDAPRGSVLAPSFGGTVRFGSIHVAGNVGESFRNQLRFRAIGSDGDDRANVISPLTGNFDAYSSLDACVRYKVFRQAILSLRVFNLGNEREAPVFGYPNQGRRFAIEFATQ